MTQSGHMSSFVDRDHGNRRWHDAAMPDKPAPGDAPTFAISHTGLGNRGIQTTGRLVATQPRVHHLGKNLLPTSVPVIVVVAGEYRHHDPLFGHNENSLVAVPGGANDAVAIVSSEIWPGYHMKPYP